MKFVMGNMNKAALVSAINSNYGTMLQAYALQKKLQMIGIESEILNFRSSPIRQFYRIFNIPFLRTKWKSYRISYITRTRYPEIFTKIRQREEAFDRFRVQRLRMTKRIKSKNELKKFIENYDIAVLGSDQVWNPQNLEMDYYTLNFVPDRMPKLTYAPSFGVSQIPRVQMDRTRKYLSRIRHISVREENGKQIVEDITGRKVPVVCDPTALLTPDIWSVFSSNRVYIGKPYIFCYFLGANIQHREFAVKIAKQMKTSIVSIQHMDEFVEADMDFGDMAIFDADPSDFVSLIQNAEMILTDSFHGTMFSIYFKKRFFTFNYDDGKTNSVNSRIDSISNILKIGNRRVTGNEKVNDYMLQEPDWRKIHEKLSSFRNESEQYLTEALVDCGMKLNI